MALHAIILEEENDKVVKRINEHYPENYGVNATCFFVRTVDISAKVADNVGIKGDDRVQDSAGGVFKLNGAYSGHATRAIWEWLSIKDDE